MKAEVSRKCLCRLFGMKLLADLINCREKLKCCLFGVGGYHHEKFDGSGYLAGLIGCEIPLEARIFALADVYDALRSKRPYKEPMSHEEAMEIIKKGRGGHFDPDVVDAFLKCEKEFAQIAKSATIGYGGSEELPAV